MSWCGSTRKVTTEGSAHDLRREPAGPAPAWQVDGLLEDYAHYRRGEAAAVLPTVADVTGHAPRDVAEFARGYAEAFR